MNTDGDHPLKPMNAVKPSDPPAGCRWARDPVSGLQGWTSGPVHSLLDVARDRRPMDATLAGERHSLSVLGGLRQCACVRRECGRFRVPPEERKARWVIGEQPQ
jgi:hypothetical protein